MKYTYVVAWSVIGGISLPESGPIELIVTPDSRFVLTREPDELLEKVDRRSAIGQIMLGGIVGKGYEGDRSAAVQALMVDIRKRRRERIGSNAVLVYIASGDVDAAVPEKHAAIDDDIVAFEITDTAALRRAHLHEAEAMKMAVAFEGESLSRFVTLTEGVYLTADDGKTVYDMRFGMSGEMTSSRPLTAGAVEKISRRYESVQQIKDLESVHRLFSHMADYEGDRLKVFLSGWAALEILVQKAFKKCEEMFLSPLRGGGQVVTRERFLARIKDVMKDKYRLTDKFLAVMAVMLPDDSAAEGDIAMFKRIKELRDAIFHGDEFRERDLPVHELGALLRKYTLAYIELVERGGASP